MLQEKQNLLVCKASAGSGKTFKLVNEYLKLCFTSNSPFKFRKILAITFTNKAAAEMKERIIQHLHALSSAEDSSDYRADWMEHYSNITHLKPEVLREKSKNILTSILHDYSSFSISTIDKFTHKIIRNFARDLKLSADFDIEMDPEFTLEKTVDEVISLAGTESEVTDILIRYMTYLLSEEDNWKIETNLRTFSKELLNEGVDEHLELLHKISPEEFRNIIDKIYTFCHSEENYLIEISHSFFEKCRENNFDEGSFHYGSGGPFKLFKHIKNRNFEELDLGTRISDALTKNEIFHKSIRKSIDPETNRTITENFEAVKIWIESRKPKYIAYRLLHKNLYNLSLINQLAEKFKQVNEDDNVVLMSEFNRIISEVIKNDPAPFIYERIGERYNHILIDEFQDTSELQFTNLIPLIENCLANGNQCLLVGDPKQAIYRWRGGDVDQFIHLPQLNNFNQPYTQEIFSDQFREELLTHNYRSGKNIVEFNNQFFNLASSTLKHTYQPIYSHLNQEYVNPEGYVELELIPDEKEEKEEKMLQHILDRIKECVNDGYRLSDICIITRGNKESGKVAEKLHMENIPVISKESLFLENSPEVELIMNFVKYLAYPNDKYAGFKVIELFQKIFTDEETPVSFYEQFKVKSSVFAAEKFLKGVGILYNRNYLLNQNSFQLIDEVIQLFFRNEISIYLRFLSEYIFTQWQKQPMAIHELCVWWDEKKEKLSIQSSENIEAIRTMTIHGSKGLQFPVVIFPYASWRIKNSKPWLWINLNKQEFPIETFLVKSDSRKLDHTNFAEVKQDEKSKSNLDDLNMVYVAFTRPEDRLYILSYDDSNYIQDLRPHLINSLQPDEKNELKWAKGSKTKNQHQPKKFGTVYPVHYLHEKKWDERLRLSLAPNKNSDEKNEEYELKIIGIVMHAIFEKSDNLKDAIINLTQYRKQDPVIEKHHDAIKTEIIAAYEHPVIKELNLHENHISEATIIDNDGQSYRPDKIFIKDKSVIILDYKTGGLKDDHIRQITEYAELFGQIGYSVEKKYLYYTKDSNLLSV